MFRPALTALMIASLPAAGLAATEPADADVRSAITQYFSLPLEEARERTGTLYDKFAGADEVPITIEEFMSVPLADRVEHHPDAEEMKLQIFQVLDQDGSGRITREEWDKQIDRDLGFADANDDGKITLRELATAQAADPTGRVLILLF